MRNYNSIHRQQLFHWIGSHIDSKAENGKLSDSERSEYVDCLEGALKNGLWLKTPRDPDYLGDGKLIKVTRPICCFTEWSLGQSMPHTSKYGRLGLGFPKRFILARGGQPVTYVRDVSRGNPYINALNNVAGLLQGSSLDGKVPNAALMKARDHFDFLCHFNKRIRKQAAKRPKGRVSKNASRASQPKVSDPFVRTYGGTLHYLEEREWRIVYDRSLASFFDPGPGIPAHFLKFLPGKELFTIVLPDNATVSLALQRTPIRAALFSPHMPHVTVLSLQDIGTF